MALEQIVTHAITSAVTRVVNTTVQTSVEKNANQAETDFAEEYKKVTTSGFYSGITMKYFGWPMIIIFGLLLILSFGLIFSEGIDAMVSLVAPAFFGIFFILAVFLKITAKKSMYILQFNYRGIWIFDQNGIFLDYIDGGSISARTYHLNTLKLQSESGKKYKLKRLQGENWDSMTELFNQFHVI